MAHLPQHSRIQRVATFRTRKASTIPWNCKTRHLKKKQFANLCPLCQPWLGPGDTLGVIAAASFEAVKPSSPDWSKWWTRDGPRSAGPHFSHELPRIVANNPPQSGNLPWDSQSIWTVRCIIWWCYIMLCPFLCIGSAPMYFQNFCLLSVVAHEKDTKSPTLRFLSVPSLVVYPCCFWSAETWWRCHKQCSGVSVWPNWIGPQFGMDVWLLSDLSVWTKLTYRLQHPPKIFDLAASTNASDPLWIHTKMSFAGVFWGTTCHSSLSMYKIKCLQHAHTLQEFLHIKQRCNNVFGHSNWQ